MSGACLVSVWVRVGSSLVHVRFLSGACPLRVWFVTGFVCGFVSGFAFVFVAFGSCPVRGLVCVWVRVWLVSGSYPVVFGSYLV